MTSEIEELLKTQIAGDYDVIVAGAGPAGVPAAIAAARNGARVLLIESNGCLGGVWTAGQLTWVFDIQRTAIGEEIIQGLHELDACVLAPGEDMHNFTYDVESMKFLLEKMCLDAGVDVLLHTRVVAAHIENKQMRAIMTESKSGRQAWTASCFIDCTGEGDLGALAGNAFDKGSEEDGAMQPMTHMAMIAVKDVQTVSDQVSFYDGHYNHTPSQIKFKKTLDDLGIETSYGHPTLFQVKDDLLALMINHQYGVDSCDAAAVTKASMAARAEIFSVVKRLAESDGPFKDVQLVSTAEYIGVREGRRLRGHYKVCIEDLMSGKRHDDAVTRVRFNVDIHSTDPAKDKGLKTVKVIPYDIPLRALVAKDVDGLLMAGRCISGDWKSFASYRVTGDAVSMGEAVGAVAALAVTSKRLPLDIPWSEVAVRIPELR